MAFAASTDPASPGWQAVVRNFSRCVACASAPDQNHGSGQSVNGCQRLSPSGCTGTGCQRLQVHHVIRDAQALVAEIVPAALAISTTSLVLENAQLT